MKTMLKAGLCALALAGCTNPETAPIISQPKTPISKGKTNFTETLRCMDTMFLRNGRTGIMVATDGLPDATGSVAVSGRYMMYTALQSMSERSGAFKIKDMQILDKGTGQPTIGQIVEETVVPKHLRKLPRVVIMGAISQVDRGPSRDSISGGLATTLASLGLSFDQVLSTIDIDLTLQDSVSRTLIPGTQTKNRIVVASRGYGANAEAIVGSGATFFEVSRDRAEGTGQAVRTLIELSLIEAMGKYMNVPYWQCLNVNSTDPEFSTHTRRWYDGLTQPERIRVVKRAMASAGLYAGSMDGASNQTFQEAVSRYKRTKGLIANGRVDYDLYHHLVSENAVVSPEPFDIAQKPGARRPYLQEADYTLRQDPQGRGSEEGTNFIGLDVKVAGGSTVQRAGTPFQLQISVKRQSAVYCYFEFYKNGELQVMRIFPNRYQSNNLMQPGQKIAIPAKGARYLLLASQPGTKEQVTCLAKEGGYTRDKLPVVAQEQDLEPLRSTRQIAGAIVQHQNADALQTGQDTVTWQVR